ncbi:MAG TPA: chromate efflux transporter [Candidatus Binatia bacterium]|nr:chromate efflux transporter [Candidatus Binatia bacterium]
MRRGERPPGRAPLGEVAALFLRLGLTAFGGPAAHVAMMEHEAVVRRRWLSRERFLDLLGVASVLPGPGSSELAIYLGYVRAGWPGLLLGGACFIAPAAVLVAVLAHLYARFGALPQAAGVLYGVRPVVVAIVLHAVWRLARTAVRDAASAAVALGAAALSVAGLAPVTALLAAGIALAAIRAPRRGLPVVLPALSGGAPAGAAVGLGSLFLVFVKVGALVFGSGYVLLAFLRADLVERLGWLTERQLLDAVAVGQVTPGPVFTTATFVGYLLAGWVGAAVATAGVFLPAFVLVAASGPFVAALRRSTLVASVLDGVTVGSLALMAVVTWQLARAALVDVPTAVLALAGAVALLRLRLGSTWLIAAGAALGTVLGGPRAP